MFSIWVYFTFEDGYRELLIILGCGSLMIMLVVFIVYAIVAILAWVFMVVCVAESQNIVIENIITQ